LPPTLAFSGNAITMAGGVPVLHFDTVMGFRYGLDYRDSLTEGTWLAVISEPGFPPPDGWSTNLAHPPTTLTDTNAANRPKTFYRLKAASP
jgi:hypothetical protein